MRVRHSIVIGFIAVLSCAIGAPPAKAQTVALVSGAQKLSLIPAANFAATIASALIVNGNANCLEATFLFQQCYGGGMFPSLAKALGNTIPWVGGSASAANQPAYGQYNSANPPKGIPANATSNNNGMMVPLTSKTPTSYWTPVLATQLGNGKQTVLQAIQNANPDDPVGGKGASYMTGNKKVTMLETGQSTSANGGNTIVLTDPNATAYDAVLWVGQMDRARYPNNLTAIDNTLNAAWGGQNKPVNILYCGGSGAGNMSGTSLANAAPATLSSLGKVLTGLNLNNTTEFLFYATDHGAEGTSLLSLKNPLADGASDTIDYNLDSSFVTYLQGENIAAQMEDNMPGFNPYEPYVEVDYDSLTSDSAAAVYAGSDLLGYLPSADTCFDFNIPISDIGVDDSITVTNSGSSTFNLDDLTFYSGADGDDPPVVPEPSAASMGLLATMFFGFSRKMGRRLHRLV